MLLIVVKKHLNSECTEDVSVELTEEVGAAQDKDGTFRRWLHRFRPSKASEAHYANKREDVGLRRVVSTLVSFYHAEKGVNLAVRGDDFTFTEHEALNSAGELVNGWYELKVRARLGPGRPCRQGGDLTRKYGTMAGVRSRASRIRSTQRRC